MTPAQLHSAGATVRHASPFAALEVPVTSEPLLAELLKTWVLPLYFGLRQPHIEEFLASRLPLVTDELVRQLLSQFDWRPRSCGAYLVALTDRKVFTDHIGRLLVRSDVCYAGAAYCGTLAELNTPEGNSFLEQYLGYYLQRADLWFDQGAAMAAVAYLDKANNTDKLSQYLPLWQAFVSNKTNWSLDKSIAWFEENMEILHALKAAMPGA